MQVTSDSVRVDEVTLQESRSDYLRLHFFLQPRGGRGDIYSYSAGLAREERRGAGKAMSRREEEG